MINQLSGLWAAAKDRMHDPIWRYRFGVGLLIISTIMLFLVALQADEGSIIQRVCSPLSEALIATSVLALLVDPYVKVRLAREIANDLTWALTSPDCPQPYQALIREIVTLESYVDANQTVIEFSWATEDHSYLQLDMTMSLNMRNVSRTALIKPWRNMWILKSTDDYQSAFTSWRLRAIDEDPPFDEHLQESELKQFTETLSDGRLSLNEDKIHHHLKVDLLIPPGHRFTREVSRRMVRHAVGHLPIVTNNPGSRYELRCRGPALRDLQINLLRGNSPVELTPHGDELRFTDQRAMIPGQFTLVSWKAASSATPNPPIEESQEQSLATSTRGN